MRTIEVEDDVYQAILQRAVEIGEGASAILRRELGLKRPNGAAPPNATDRHEKELLEFVGEPTFRLKRATDQYLALLSFLHRKHGEEFGRVLDISGSRRKYFGRSRKEISESGKSTHPRQIPGSDYWAMTNASTLNKQQMLRKVLVALGYGNGVARRVAAALT